MSRASLRIPTPLGDLEFLAEEINESGLQLSLNSVEFEPLLPPGMSVTACHCVLLHINLPVKTTEIQFEAKLHSNVALEHGAETGEGLDAQAWRSKQFVLLVGTEDMGLLTARLPHIVVNGYPITYSENSLAIRVTCPLNTDLLSLHFVVAWNELPEPGDCSCWFAVDQRHSEIAAALN